MFRVVVGSLLSGALALMTCGSAAAAPVGAFTEFTIPTANSFPQGIAAGPDGNLWFTESAGNVNKIGRITPTGTVTEFSTPTTGSNPYAIAAGPDGNLWFNEGVGQIGRLTPTGVFTEFTAPTPSSAPAAIATGPDGNLWFTEFNANKIGRVGAGASAPSVRLPSVTGVW